MIHQTDVILNTSFAFKTYCKQHETEEQMFRTPIAEITMLGQPFIREHANIVQLQGICWDISLMTTSCSQFWSLRNRI